MAQFKYTKSEEEVIASFKRNFLYTLGPSYKVVKESKNEFVIKNPIPFPFIVCKATVKFSNGVCTTTPGFLGKTTENAVNLVIDLIDGVTRID